MKAQFDGQNYLVRLEKGECLVENLTKFVAEKDIRGAWLNAIGGASWVELGFYQLENTQEYEWHRLEQSLEITGLQGNVAWHDGAPFLHIHGTFSDDQMLVFGGHVKELEVSGTCEVFIQVWAKDKLQRSRNEEVGLKLLDL